MLKYNKDNPTPKRITGIITEMQGEDPNPYLTINFFLLNKTFFQNCEIL